MKGAFFIGWRQVAACFVLQGVSTATISAAYSIVAIPLSHAFEPSRMVLMLAMTVLALGIGILSPLCGWAMDRSSLRNLMLVGAGLLVAGWIALSFATSMTQVLVIYGLVMAPANTLLSTLPTATLLSRWFVKHRGRALGIAAMGIATGAMVFSPIIQGLISAYDWRVAFRLLSAICFFCTFPVILTLVVDRPEDRDLHPDGDASASTSASAEPSGTATPASILRNGNFWLISFWVVVVLCGTKGLVSNLAPLAIDVGVAPGAAALLLSTFAVAGLIGQLIFAAIADRFGQREILCAVLAGVAIGMVCFWQASDYRLMAAGGALLGIAGSTFVPLWGLMLSRTFGPPNVGRVMGLITMAMTPFNLLTPPLFGFVYDATGSYAYALIGFALLAAAAILSTPRLRAIEPGTIDTAAA